MDLHDPTADYCKEYAKILTKYVKGSIGIWYRLYRAFGCAASDAIRMARWMVQKDIDRCDFSVNFDGPMLR